MRIIDAAARNVDSQGPGYTHFGLVSKSKIFMDKIHTLIIS